MGVKPAFVVVAVAAAADDALRCVLFVFSAADVRRCAADVHR